MQGSQQSYSSCLQVAMEGEQAARPSKFTRICVFCGSSQGKKRSYQDAAVELGKELVSRNIDLVYGGGSVGLMGLVSQAVHEGGRHVIGVIPKTLMPREITGETVGEVKAVAGMHQRKAEMARHSDAFIALPGGYGTLEELLEVIAWAQLGIHDKPVGLLNVDGYYNSLLCFIDKAVEEGFISPNARHIIVSAPTDQKSYLKMEFEVVKRILILFLLASAALPTESLPGIRKLIFQPPVLAGADGLHPRFLMVRTNDYGPYDPSPAMDRPPYKQIPN